MLDKLYSVVCSNQLASGMQNFWQPPGNGLTRVQIAGGLNLIESAIKPEPLEMLATPKEIFEFINKLENIMETLTNVSAVNRGNVPENLKSGTALAYVASQAITFSSGLQKSFINMMQDGATILLYTIRDFQPEEKSMIISGQFNRPMEKKYKGDDLKFVDKVVVETTSALSKTQAGKIQIAQDLLQSNLIRNQREYINIITTGQIDTLWESEMSEIILIKAENEDLRDGKTVTALACDDHKAHWLEHRSILSSPQARQNPMIVELVTNHMLEHQQMAMALQLQNPQILAWMGETPMPMPMQPPQMQGQQATPNVVDSRNPVEQQAEGVQAPRKPNLPKGADENTAQSYEKEQAIQEG